MNARQRRRAKRAERRAFERRYPKLVEAARAYQDDIRSGRLTVPAHCKTCTCPGHAQPRSA